MTTRERRKAHRVRMGHNVDMGAEQAVIHPDMVQDLSLGGLSFVSAGALRAGDELRLALSLPNEEGRPDEVTARCRVTEAMPAGDGHFRVGVEFVELEGDGEARLTDYLERVTALL